MDWRNFLRREEDRPVRVVGYRGYGTAQLVRVRGRVLYGHPPRPAAPEDRWWVNFANTFRRLESDEVPGARVCVRFRGAEAEAVADVEGHFIAELRPRTPLAPDRLWHDARIELVEPAHDLADAPVAIPVRPRFGVISDLDDTVLQSHVRNMIRMGREVLFGNVHTRMPFPGIGAFYRALHEGDDGAVNPIFYVSSSPWNLYDLLADFLRLHRIPAGPMELRDWRISRTDLLAGRHRDHKRRAIHAILATYPHLPFILVGDSAQEDPEIYREVIHDRPGRVLAVYIRSVTSDPLRIDGVRALAREIAEAHADAEHPAPELVLVDDTLAAARHAADRGWIARERLEEVKERRVEEAT